MARPPKRKASSTSNAKHQETNAKQKYAPDREPSLKERLRLPERFHTPYVWPVDKILAERGGEYLVDWEPHPETGEVWKPEWRAEKDVGDELIEIWKGKKRQGWESTSALSESNRVSKRPADDLEQRSVSKKRKLLRQIDVVTTPTRRSISDAAASDSPETPLLRKRPTRLVISPPSPPTEIQETQEQGSNNTDSIQVNVPSITRINPDDYQILPDSSGSIALPESTIHPSSSSTKDQEADSALGLSSPVDENHSRPTGTVVDHNSQNSPRLAISSSITSDPHPPQSVSTVQPAGSADHRTTQLKPVTTLLVHRSDPIENTPGSQSNPASELDQGNISTAASSPLFFPDTRADEAPAIADNDAGAATSGQASEASQIDTSAQQRNDQSLTFLLSSDLVPLPASTNPKQRTQPLNSTHSELALASPTIDRSAAFTTLSPTSTVSGLSLSQPVRDALVFKKPVIAPVPQIPRSKLFQTLRENPRPSQRSIESMSARSRESSPRIRRSAPPSAEQVIPGVNLRETLMKQTAPARELQKARHIRSANRLATRGSSVATTATPTPGAATRAFPTAIDTTPTPDPIRMALQGAITPGASSPKTEESSPLQLYPVINRTPASMMQFNSSEPALISTITPAASVYTTALGSSMLPVQASIEDDQPLPQSIRVSLPSYPILGPAEYVVPLPAEGKIKDHYLECIRGKRRSLEKFTRNPKSTGRANMSRTSADEADQMRSLIERLNDTTTHLDLGLDGPGTQHADSVVNEATWTYYASSKFAFLYHLVVALRDFDCCIMVMAKEGQTLDLLETYMEANHVNYRRHPESAATDAYRIEGSKGLVRVELLGTSTYPEKLSIRRPTLIVAFDTSFDPQDTKIQQLRQSTSEVLIPIIYPIVLNSAEHVEICIPRSMPSPQRFRMLLQTTFRARERLGGDPIPDPSDSHAEPLIGKNLFAELKKSLGKRINLLAVAVAKAATTDGFDSTWPIPNLELEPWSETSSEPSTVTSTTPRSRAGTPSAVQKRLRDGESASTMSSKRQRLTPAAESTHISDSIRDSQSQVENLRQALRKAEHDAAEEKKARITAEVESADKAKLLEDISRSLGELQTRYETRMKSSHQLKRDNQKLQHEKEVIEKRQEKLLSDIAAVREQERKTKVELAEAREALVAGGGSVAELELYKAEVRRLTEKNSSLERSAANTRKDFEFTRSHYQEASTAAADLARQNAELGTQNADLTRRASDEKRRLNEVNYKTDLEQHLARILELELVLKNREVMLQRKEEELKALKKGRGVATRGSSVQPSSPRPAGSRGGSPAPGLLGSGIHTGNRASALRNER